MVKLLGTKFLTLAAHDATITDADWSSDRDMGASPRLDGVGENSKFLEPYT